MNPMRSAVVLDNLRMVYRDIGRSLIEIVNGITPFAHHLGYQTIGDADGSCRIVDEPGLHLAPAGGEVRQGRRCQRNNLELVSLAFPGGEFLLGCLLASGLGYQTFVLAAIVLLHSRCFPATAQQACRDEYRG